MSALHDLRLPGASAKRSFITLRSRMRLEKVQFHGYKRFLAPTILLVGRPLTAIVGLNEAGKSSVLSGTAAISDRQLSPDDFNLRFTDEKRPIVTAEFSIDEAEVAGVKGWLQAVPTRLVLHLFRDGNGTFDFVPNPRYPDIGPIRRAAVAALDRILKSPDNESFVFALAGLAHMNLSVLRTGLSTGRSLVPEDLHLIGELATGRHARLIGRPDDEIAAVTSAFQALGRDHELRQRAAHDRMTSHLIPRWPKMMLFDPSQHVLPMDTSLSDETEEGVRRRALIFNLIRLGGQSGKTLLDHIASGRNREALTLLAQAQRQINAKIAGVWPAGPIEVQLKLTGTNLEVHVADPATAEVLPLHARSQGLRTLLSLLAFIQHHDAEHNLVILIDEIETHLHVDAQRHLIQALEQLPPHQQFIYTTHSPFALPSDLSAVREVVSNPGNGTSTINNHLWQNTTSGLLGLHVRMGAASAGSWVARHTLVVEGVTDAALLPRMLDEALGGGSVPFMCIPGYPYAGKDPLVFEAQAVNVAYLFDGDQAGKGYAKQLSKRGVADDRIFFWDEGAMLEDYLSEALFIAAAQAAARTYQKNPLPVPPGSLPGPDRYRQLQALCGAAHIAVPSKNSVAAKVLELWASSPVRLDEGRRPALTSIAQRIQGVFSDRAMPRGQRAETALTTAPTAR